MGEPLGVLKLVTDQTGPSDRSLRLDRTSSSSQNEKNHVFIKLDNLLVSLRIVISTIKTIKKSDSRVVIF